MSTQCQGRVVRGRKVDGIKILPFDTGEGKAPKGFFLPARCEKMAEGGERICWKCKERDERTRKLIGDVYNGKPVNNQDAYFHGYIGENPPDWSHAYGSKWFINFQKKTGLGISEAVMAKVLEALHTCPGAEVNAPREETASSPVEMKTATEPAVVKPKKKIAIKKREKEVTTPEPVPEAMPAHEAPKPKPKPRAKKAKAVVAQVAPTTPIAVIEPAASMKGEFEVLQIPVRKVVIDERQVYLSSVKDKVYDLKFKYIGRYNRRADKIESQFPDTDEE